MHVPEGARLGVELPGELSLAEKLKLCSWADDRGFDDAWLAEITDPDAFVTLGAAALRTSRIRLGTAIIPLGTRSIPVIAAGASTVAELGSGRFVLGVGVSSDVIIQDWNGMQRGRPLGRARESLTLLRALFAGERSDQVGEFVSSKGFRLRHRRPAPPPLVLAALNVRMLELAGEMADGVFLNFVPTSAVPQVLESIHRGAERAGRDSPPELMLNIVGEVTDDPHAARRRLAHQLAFYLSVPPYQKALTWYGFDDEVRRAKSNWKRGGIERVRDEISDEFLDGVAAIGTALHCQQRISDYWAAGITCVGVCPPAASPRDTLEHFAPTASMAQVTGR